MLDIDIDFLKFLLWPTSFEYLHDKILLIKEEYIREYGEENRNLIENNFDNIYYIFLEDIDKCLEFIDEFSSSLVRDIFNKVIMIFNFEDCPDISCFISNLYNEQNFSQLEEDKDLYFINVLIKPYVNEKIVTSNDKEKLMLIEKLSFLDVYLNKYNEIKSLLDLKLKEINKVKLENVEYRLNLQKEFLFLNICCINEKDKNALVTNNYNFSKLASVCPEIELYVEDYENSVFELGYLGAFYGMLKNDFVDRDVIKRILKKYGIDYENEKFSIADIDECLKGLNVRYKDDKLGIVYYGKEALFKLVDGIEKYDKCYQEYLNLRKYLPLRNEFFNNHINMDNFKSDILKEKARDLTNLDINDFYKIFKRIFDVIVFNAQIPSTEAFVMNYAISDDVYNMRFNYLVMKIYDTFKFDYNNKNIVSHFFESLIHELGHVAVNSNETCVNGFYISSEYMILNELFTEWLALKIWNRFNQLELFNVYSFEKKIVSPYRGSFILIESFVLEFEDYFKEASLKHDISVFEKLMTSELFLEYVDLVNVAFGDEIYDWVLDSKDNDADLIRLKEDLNGILNQVKKFVKSRIKRRIDC